MRAELTTAIRQLPDASGLGWHSRAADVFGSRLAELADLMRDAISALSIADDDLAAQLTRLAHEEQSRGEPLPAFGCREATDEVR